MTKFRAQHKEVCFKIIGCVPFQVSVWITNWRSGTQQWAIIKSRITVTCFDVSNLVSQHVANVTVPTDHEGK